jgi:hypothetical protein
MDQSFPSHFSYLVFDSDSAIDVPDTDHFEIVLKFRLIPIHWLIFTYNTDLVLKVT